MFVGLLCAYLKHACTHSCHSVSVSVASKATAHEPHFARHAKF